MKLFKPYVNLTKKEDATGITLYALHSVINLPVGYQYQSTTQSEIETPNGQKRWKVVLNFAPNGESLDNTLMQEFNTILDEGPTNDRHKIQLSVNTVTNSELLTASSSSSSETDVDYGDAEEDID